MTAEEFDALSFHKGMVVHCLEPKTVNNHNPTRIMEYLIDTVDFIKGDCGGVIYVDEKGYRTFIHYSRIVRIKQSTMQDKETQGKS